MIYLDHAATTPPLPCALEAYRTAPFGNPSSEHAAGQAARDALEQAREKIAKCIGSEPEQIIFTSGSTEACALAMNSLSKNGYRVMYSPYEHHAVSENRTLNGNEQTDAFALMWANNETGEIYVMPKRWEKGEQIFTDATTAVGHVPVNAGGVDCMAFGAHKFGGVLGAGVLYARDPNTITPLIRGGGQERGMRSGTENVPAICAMAAALEWQTEHMDENIQKLAALRSMLFYSLSEIPNHKWNTPFNKPCLPHILNISFDGVDAHALALILSKDGVMVSPGAACSNGLHEPSHVIMAMFNDEARARSAVRISMSHENTADEIAEAGQKIKDAVAYLRSLS